MPVALRLLQKQGLPGANPTSYNGNLSDKDSPFQITAIYPAQPAIEVPANIPAPVQRAYTQAAENRRSGHYDAAAAMYRKAMELALKDRSPEIDAWKIEKRIDKMAQQGLITKELHDWAHELRLDGNDAVHEDEMERGPVDDMHSFCKFLLTYLYTLPEQVKAARARRARDE